MEEEDAILGLTLNLGSAPAGSGEEEGPSHTTANATSLNGETEDAWGALETEVNEAADVALDKGSDGGDSESDDDSDDDDDHNENTNGADDSDGEKDGVEEGASSGAAPSAATAVSAGEYSDEQLLRITHKKEAKRLGETAYKRWKKLQHKASKKDKKKHSDKDAKKKEKKKKKSSRHKSGGGGDDDNEGREKRHREKKHREKKKSKQGDDDGFTGDGTAPSTSRKRRRGKGGEGEGGGNVVHRDPMDADDDDDVPFIPEYDADDLLQRGQGGENDDAQRRSGGGGGLNKAARREQLQRDAAALGKAKRLSADQEKARSQMLAEAIVREMQTARAKDELAIAKNTKGRSGAAAAAAKSMSLPFARGDGGAAIPLHRVAIKDMVETQCLRKFLIGPLIDAGILQELSTWLYDFDHAEPAPFELRCTALDILLRFPVEGELEGKNKPGRNGEEDLTLFTGMTRENLIHTDLGRAVNALRLHQQEIPENRTKCVQLLERLSRAMSGGINRSSRGPTVRWKCQGDPSIASPFEVVETGSEAFQKAFMKPDPRDPSSYHNVLPWRPPVTAITNLSGKLANEIVNGAFDDDD